jgi:enoyl-CoA hydratase/carnithine racemase
MPELKNGVACTLGCAMTEYLFGRFIMQEICYGGNKIAMEKALHWKLVNEHADAHSLLQRAIEKAAEYAAFPSKAFQGTKHINNRRYIEILENARQDTVDVHTDVFMNREHKNHMENILKRKAP